MEEDLNVDSLEAILDSLLPTKNKKDDEPYAEILEELRYFGISTQEELRTVIKKHMDYALAREAQRVEENRRRLRQNKGVPGTSRERAKRGLFFSYQGFVRIFMAKAFPQKSEEYRDQRLGVGVRRGPT
jgi:hypothetical protein